MKLLLFALCFTSFAQSQVLISGYDDVPRQSNNTSLVNVIRHFFKDDKGYAGMPKLYQMLLKRTGQERFHLLTAAPSFLKEHVSGFLKSQNFPEVELHLRNVFTSPFLKSYRLGNLEEICPNQDCIWITDTSDSILDVITELKDWKGEIYLRETVKKDYPAGVSPFITTFDLALYQLPKGRLSRKDVETLLVDLLAEQDPEQLIPNYAHCPRDYDPCGPGIFPLCERFKLKIQDICTKREKKE